jgi:hypothetical protein|tara:strand:+ start:1030 stop:1401 length:372 start_codon:yes stop_codon:yes gene_type:complete
MLDQRISVKRVFETQMDISKSRQYQDITSMTERIMSLILDYEAFCELQDTENHKRMMAPKRILGLFQKKIGEKMLNITKTKGGEVKLKGLKMDSHSQERSALNDSKDYFDTSPYKKPSSQTRV